MSEHESRLREVLDWDAKHNVLSTVGQAIRWALAELTAQRQRAETAEALVAGIESHVVKQWPNEGLGYDRKNLPAIVMWIIEERDRVYLKGTADHDHGEKCPTYYDGCNCTVEALEHNIKRAETAERERDEALKELAILRPGMCCADHRANELKRELDAAVEHHASYTKAIDLALGEPRYSGSLQQSHCARIDQLTADLAAALQWKAEALPLLTQYDAISESIGGKLGSSKVENLKRWVEQARK